MPDLQDGASVEVQGSASRPYVLKNVGGVYSCSCPAWRNQSLSIERRTCKHLRQLRGDAAEELRIGSALPTVATSSDKPTPPALLLAETWDGILDPTDWWLSEKLDGVRAFWNGEVFLSRQGNRYYAPDWFTARFPKVPLDGELWIERKQFQRTVSIVRRHDQTDLWREVCFQVFDAPACPGTFEGRIEYAQAVVQEWHSEFILFDPQIRCEGKAHLEEELERILRLGGEGVMLRQPGSPYVGRRSATLLKVKRFLDADARVIEHQPGAGRHRGRLGALLVVLPNGIQFAVGTGFTDAQRENPPPIGATVSFRYQELSDGGVPRFPTFVGVRLDEPPACHQQHQSRGESHVAAVKAKRRFEFVGGNSDKFWEMELEGSSVTVRFGRNGTSGQASVKHFADAAKAEKHAEKMIGEKLGKGYVEVQ
ncbi:MAG: DNA ligase [Planctomycetia bacterium]|nr:DNA ligase [Planctomycetia bacterium]